MTNDKTGRFVLFLGAGGSRAFGYPVTSEILPLVAKRAKAIPFSATEAPGRRGLPRRMTMAGFKIEKPYYPIVYVRGYAMRAAEREETFNDTYYGFSATSVEKRQAPPPQYFEADVFEGQLIRLMKIKDYGYADAVNRGLEVFHSNPARSVWIARFYDQDVFRDTVRSIETHAEDLYTLVCETIPQRLRSAGVDHGQNDRDYRVILIAHSMGGLVCRTSSSSSPSGRAARISTGGSRIHARTPFASSATIFRAACCSTPHSSTPA